MKCLRLKLTNKQLYDIRKFVSDNGFPEGCSVNGKHFGLISQPFINDFRERLDIVFLTEKEFNILDKIIKKMVGKKC